MPEAQPIAPSARRAGATAAACWASPSSTQQAAGAATASVAAAPVLRNDAFKGIYEVAAADDGASVFVATINGFDPRNAGFIQRLDARTLAPQQTIQVPRRAFALGLNKVTNTLYVGNTMEGSLSVVDAASGVVKGQIHWPGPRRTTGVKSPARTPARSPSTKRTTACS